MSTRSSNLTEHFDHYLSEALASGRCGNASEVVRAGLRLLEHEEPRQGSGQSFEALRNAFHEGQAAIEQGDLSVMESDAEIDAFFDAIETEIARG